MRTWQTSTDTKQCEHCREWFRPKFASQRLCYPKCWRKQRTALAEYDSLKSTIRTLQSALLAQRIKAAPAKPASGSLDDSLSSTELRWLINKAHPDKNPDSEMAHAVTKQLIALKDGKK